MNSNQSLFDRVMNAFDRVALATSSVAIALMAIIIVLGVVFRYFLKAPLIWTDEAARFLLIFVTFIGAIPVMSRGGFGEVEAVMEALTPSGRRVLSLVNGVLSVIFTGASFLISFYLVVVSQAIRHQNSPALGIPMWVVYTVLPVAFFMMFLREIHTFLTKTLPGKETKVETTGTL